MFLYFSIQVGNYEFKRKNFNAKCKSENRTVLLPITMMKCGLVYKGKLPAAVGKRK